MLIYLQIIETQEEKSKFEILYREYRSCMYRVAFGILHNCADAEDAVHAAFLKIAENIQKIEEPVCHKTKGLLITIVRNMAIDLYRKKQRHPQEEYIETVYGESAVYEGKNAVARCILKLPEQQQNILFLRYQYGYDLQEIAKMLGISYTNARQIAYRAKENLRKLCWEEGIEC